MVDMRSLAMSKISLSKDLKFQRGALALLLEDGGGEVFLSPREMRRNGLVHFQKHVGKVGARNIGHGLPAFKLPGWPYKAERPPPRRAAKEALIP